VIRYLDGAVAREKLTGGTHHAVWLATQPDGTRLVVKATPGAPEGMFADEAEGLRVLRDSGAVGAPAVLDVGETFLVLEHLPPIPEPGSPAAGPYWERAGRALAALHAIGNDRFGWHADNWLGPTRQYNPWTPDCYAFFAQWRILRYLNEPFAQRTLEPVHRRAIERLCARLPELVPPARPALTHGDLWPGNMMSTVDGGPAFIDPAVSYSWPGVDTSMMLYTTRSTPDAFFAAYHEIRPPEPDWREHLRVLHLREHLCVLSQGDPAAVPRILDTLSRFA
jgi:fructosamine-3-kinase